jgi:hypothetical protein
MRQRLSNAGILHRLNSIISCDDVERESLIQTCLAAPRARWVLIPKYAWLLMTRITALRRHTPLDARSSWSRTWWADRGYSCEARSDCQRPKGSVATASSSGRVAAEHPCRYMCADRTLLEVDKIPAPPPQPQISCVCPVNGRATKKGDRTEPSNLEGFVTKSPLNLGPGSEHLAVSTCLSRGVAAGVGAAISGSRFWQRKWFVC